MSTPSIDEVRENQRLARERAIYDVVILATVGVLPESTTQVTFDIKPTLVPDKYDEGDRNVITSVRVTVTRFGIEKPGEDGQGWVEVEGRGVPAKADGTPNQRARETWHPLPVELAGPLLLIGMTRSPVAERKSS